MVIGNGMIAKAFSHYKNNASVLIFAYGVSNSSETESAQFEREKKTVVAALQNNEDKLFVYFSTCSIVEQGALLTPYVLHKLNMERLINNIHNNYLIFRLPQVVGRSSNRTTLTNYLYDKIMNGEVFTIWKNAVRYLIDVEDVAKIVSYILDNKLISNRIINIASLQCSAIDIVRVLEKITNVQAKYNLVERGAFYEIDISDIAFIVKELNIQFNGNYVEKILMKYYTQK